MGELHARAYAESALVDLVSVVDSDPVRGEEVARKLGAAHRGSVDELLHDDSVEIVTVAVPDRAHVEVTSKLLRSGKSVLLEKPMADSLEGAQQIAAAAEQGRGRLMVAHLLRFDPRYAGAAEAVRRGDIGEVAHISASRFGRPDAGEKLRGTSSVCFYIGVHDVDAVQWVSGRQITRVYAETVAKIMPARGVQSEDALFAVVRFDDDAVGSLAFGWSMPAGAPSAINARLDVIGTHGEIQVNTREDGLRIFDGSNFVLPDGMHWPEVNGRLGGDLVREVTHFVTTVREGADFVVSVNEAMNAVAVNDALLRSVETGCPENVTPAVGGSKTSA